MDSWQHWFGYGVFNIGGEVYTAHNLVCTWAHGAKPYEKAVAIHSCDNPSCCNPRHLSWGTQYENLADAREKGRMDCRGEKHWQKKLTEVQVREIRQAKGVSQRKLAERYGVCQQHISKVVTGGSWQHVV